MAMIWTKEKPTKEGWYWYCGNDEPEIVQVAWNKTWKDYEVLIPTEDRTICEPVANYFGEFSSEPIQLPERK